MDLRETLLRGGDSGAAIVAGRPEESLLIEAVRYESLEMPPKGKLKSGAIADLVKWIEMGAPDPRIGKAALPQIESPISGGRDHWAFQPVTLPKPPAVRNTSWPLSAVDLFILQRLEREDLSPVKDADRYTWLRRASFDLTGLPPTVAEIREFVDDGSPDAFERVVDRLLASRAFGERWARHWLDLVGYADQIGTSIMCMLSTPGDIAIMSSMCSTKTSRWIALFANRLLAICCPGNPSKSERQT